MNMKTDHTGSSEKILCKSIRERLTVLVSVVLMITALSGCTQTITDNADRIARPSNSEAPFFGTWKLECCTGEKPEGETPDPKASLDGETISFAPDKLAYAGNFYSDISYKVKRVVTAEYFLHKSVEIPAELSSIKGDLFIITVYSEDNYLFELLTHYDEDIDKSINNIIAEIDGQFYKMKKISNKFTEASGSSRDVSGLSDSSGSRETNKQLRSGLLLGVRIPVRTKDALGDYKYRTYWISSENRTLHPVLYTDDIFLPRKDGFWKLKIFKGLAATGTEDMLAAFKVSNTGELQSPSLAANISGRIETGVRKAIIYVGNDYVCIEKTIYGSALNVPGAAGTSGADGKADGKADGNGSGGGTEKILRTLPVDNLSGIDGIKISDIAGVNGTIAMESAVSELIKNSGYEGTAKEDENEQARNFALYRKTGHWFFKGRLNMDQKEQVPYMDFNLNLIPPADMVAYDVLQVPWPTVKDKLPDAIDVYTSPNKDLAVILTRDKILAYSIENKTLSDSPVAAFRLEEGSSVIMAEWGMGEYMPIWEKSFIKNNKTKQISPIK